MNEAVVVGAGPAGAVAATVLARAGVRVRLLDRAAFPRDKLCGDTLNGGTLAVLRRLDLLSAIEGLGMRIDGMIVSGDRGASVQGRYPGGLHGLSMTRRDLDAALVSQAIRAGASFEPEVPVRSAIVDNERGMPRVTGVLIGAAGSAHVLPAPVVIAADGRRSTLAFGLGLAAHPVTPRRWAIGAYFGKPSGTSFGEMHIRRDRYIGVAPLPGGVSNVCLVRPSSPGDPNLHDPEQTLRLAIEREPLLRDRFADAPLVRPPIVLGPVATDATGGSIDGLILAGDAAGFIDPMTGDGLRFAIRGGELAAHAALQALTHGWTGVHARLAADRRREFAGKWRFNRTLRRSIASPLAMGAAEQIARVCPSLLRVLINHAGDCGLARAIDAEPAAWAESNEVSSVPSGSHTGRVSVTPGSKDAA